jgi:hypothetical protein
METFSTVAGFIRSHLEAAAIATYRIRCLRVVEVLGLYGLLTGAPTSGRVAAWLARFVATQPGASQPISDRWAVAVIPTVLLLSRGDNRAVLISYLAALNDWIAAAYQRGGLAKPESDPVDELKYLFSGVAGFDVVRRDDSYLAGVILELAGFIGLRNIYRTGRHQIDSLRAAISATTTEDTRDQYMLDGPIFRSKQARNMRTNFRANG